MLLDLKIRQILIVFDFFCKAFYITVMFLVSMYHGI